MAEGKVKTRFKRTRRVFFREWRKFRGLTQEQLAERVERAPSWVSQIERGQIAFTEEALEALAAALSCQPADLITRDPFSAISSIWDNIQKLAPEQREQVAKIIGIFQKAS